MLKAKQLEGYEKELASFEKLKKSCVNKMRTIMIGAIADLEQMYDCNDEDFEEIRKSILDRGNNLIRAFEDELKQYSVVYKGNFTIFSKEG